MANNHGGYRKPTNPAPSSGPGALSRRTDSQPKMRLSDAQYGEQAVYQSDQSGAPMAGPDSGPAGGGAPGGGGPPIDVPPFGAPTARPDEPVTSGIDLGAGPGSSSLGLLDEKAVAAKADAEALVRYLPMLEFLANRPTGSQALKSMVRTLKAQVQ